MMPGDQWLSGPILRVLQVENCFSEIQFCVLRVFGGLGMFHVFPRWHTQLGFYTGRAVAPGSPLPGKPFPAFVVVVCGTFSLQ